MYSKFLISLDRDDVLMYPYRKVNMSFPIGEMERHDVKLVVDKLWESVKISIDGIEAMKEIVPIGTRRSKDYDLRVGKDETHQVLVTISKPFLFSINKPWKYTIKVDGKKLRKKDVEIFQETLF